MEPKSSVFLKKRRSRVRFLVGRVSPVRSRTMSAIRAKGSKAEIALRKLLSSAGLRYRLHKKDLPGRPDVVFVRQRIVVFCDGDFWHGRHWKKGKWKPSVRKKYWENKIETNIARDRRNNRDLRKMGWVVLRFWETDILKQGPEILDAIQDSLRAQTKNSLSRVTK